MTPLKAALLQALEGIEGVSVTPSPVAGGTALVFRGKEFAHFHNDHELDLRLTRKVIQALGLQHPAGSLHHPQRAASSPWIELRYHDDAGVRKAVELIRIAVQQL